MYRFYAVGIGVGFGSAAGWIVEPVPSSPVVQSVVAFLIALVLANVSILVWWTRRLPGGGFYGFGIDNFVYLATACLVAAVVYIILGRISVLWTPSLVNHRAVVLGCVGGLWGTLSTIWAIAGFERATRETGDT